MAHPGVQVIATSNAPKAVGAYVQGKVFNDRVITAGQLGIDPAIALFI